MRFGNISGFANPIKNEIVNSGYFSEVSGLLLEPFTIEYNNETKKINI